MPDDDAGAAADLELDDAPAPFLTFPRFLLVVVVGAAVGAAIGWALDNRAKAPCGCHDEPAGVWQDATPDVDAALAALDALGADLGEPGAPAPAATNGHVPAAADADG